MIVVMVSVMDGELACSQTTGTVGGSETHPSQKGSLALDFEDISTLFPGV